MPLLETESLPGRRGLPIRRGISLTTRILAVNLIVLMLIAFSLFYLDSYRKQLLDERFKRATSEAEIAADALRQVPTVRHGVVIAAIGTRQHQRLRLYAPDGHLLADSFALAPPSFTLNDPTREKWPTRAGRAIDRIMDRILGTPPVPPYIEQGTAAANWPEVVEAQTRQHTILRHRHAPDRTPVITAATPISPGGPVLLTLRNQPDVTQSVRNARQTLANVVAAALFVSILLSLFLARTIVQPLRDLVRAAIRVRLGRDREVVVPRLPDRGDEIGLLARTISDMTGALRQRIDAVESFAADVAHEIKNPLASLRSALESLEKVEDDELRRQLTAIAEHDVRRIDRLVTEIADASRIDAELSRTAFEPVNILAMAQTLVEARERRGANGGRQMIISHQGEGAPIVGGDPARLERVFENLLDNAVSFSPPMGTITIAIATGNGRVTTDVRDEGPGIAPESHEKVFERFHSLRPADEDFGRHSGLGLAIARTIVEAHDGTLTARLPLPGHIGARLVMELPAYAAAGALL